MDYLCLLARSFGPGMHARSVGAVVRTAAVSAR